MDLATAGDEDAGVAAGKGAVEDGHLRALRYAYMSAWSLQRPSR